MFKSIAGGVKSIASGVGGFLGNIGSIFSGGGGTASAAGSFSPATNTKTTPSTISSGADKFGLTPADYSRAAQNWGITKAQLPSSNQTYYNPGQSANGIYQPPLPRSISSGAIKTGGGGYDTANSSLMAASYSAPRSISSASYGGGASSALSSPGGGTSPLVLPSAPKTVNPKMDNTALAGKVAGYYKLKPDGTFEEVKQEEDTFEDEVKQRNELYEKYLGVKPDVYDNPEVRAAKDNRNRIQQALLAPTEELNAIVAKQNQDLLQLRKVGAQEGVTEAVYSQQEAVVNYNAAIRALPLKASIASLQGELELAQDYLTELIDIKQNQINQQYEYNKALFNSITGVLDKRDERAYKEKVEANERAYKQEQDLISTQAKLSMEVLANGAPSSVVTRINNARTIQDALTAAGTWVGKLDRQREARLASETSSGGKVFTSGNLKLSQSDLADGQTKLRQFMGKDGYVDPFKYKEMADFWTSQGGLIQDFTKSYPPESYVNPRDNNLLPTYLQTSAKSKEITNPFAK